MQNWEILTLVLAALPLLWSAILWVAARLGPWRRLALRYPEDQWLSGPEYRFNSLHSPLTNYGFCINARTSDDLLRLEPMWPFHWHHPAILLPRSALHKLRMTRRLWMRCADCQVDGLELCLSGPMLEDPFFTTEGGSEASSAREGRSAFPG